MTKLLGKQISATGKKAQNREIYIFAREIYIFARETYILVGEGNTKIHYNSLVKMINHKKSPQILGT